MRANPHDARAPYYLGNLLYDRRRHAEAIRLWERSAKLDPETSPSSGAISASAISTFAGNRPKPAVAVRPGVPRQSSRRPAALRARPALETAWRKAGETSARTGETSGPRPAARRFERRTLRALQSDRPARQGAGNSSRTASSSRGKAAKAARSASMSAPTWRWAARQWRNVISPAPASTLNPRSPRPAIWARPNTCWPTRATFITGSVARCAGLADDQSARQHWLAAATFKGDFQEMSVRAFSEMTYYSALSLGKARPAREGRKTSARPAGLRAETPKGARRRLITSPLRCRRCCCSTTTCNSGRRRPPCFCRPRRSLGLATRHGRARCCKRFCSATRIMPWPPIFCAG